MGPKILVLTRYDQTGASSRTRFFSYQKDLVHDGFQVEYQSLLTSSYLKKLYQTGKRSFWQLLYLYINRLFFLLFKTRGYDLIWIEKELFPGLPTIIELFFLRRMSLTVLDYDDAVHLNYKTARWGRYHKIEKLMSKANMVFAGSPYLYQVAYESGQSRVLRVPTPVEVEQYRPSQRSQPLRVGWIGSPASEKYLLQIQSEILRASKTNDFKFYLMGITDPSWNQIPTVEVVPWSETSQKRLLQSIDVGLMPLSPGPWEESKCSYKILLYFAHGVPALASPVGMNNEVIEDSITGYRVESDWLEALKKIQSLTDIQYSKISQECYKKAQEKYSYPVIYQQIREVFLNLCQESQ